MCIYFMYCITCMCIENWVFVNKMFPKKNRKLENPLLALYYIQTNQPISPILMDYQKFLLIILYYVLTSIDKGLFLTI